MYKKITKSQVTRCFTNLYGFIDPDESLDNNGIRVLKPNTAVTLHLPIKKSLKQIHTDLRIAGWNMSKSSFSAEFCTDTECYWSMTKIAGPKGAGVTMRSAVNVDPSTIPQVPNKPSSSEDGGAFNLEAALASNLEDAGTSPAFRAPALLPKNWTWCSTIHTSKPPEQMDGEWSWAFQPAATE